MEDELVGCGRVVRIETTGRKTGRTIPVVVGFVERDGGAVVGDAGLMNETTDETPTPVDPAAAADRFRRLADRFQTIVAAVPADRWDAPSPCDDWTVAEVVDHVATSEAELIWRRILADASGKNQCIDSSQYSRQRTEKFPRLVTKQLHRFGGEFMSVRALPRHGEEERTRPDRARVVGEIAHLDPAAEHLHRLERCNEALIVHLGRECTREGSAYLIRRSGGTSRYWRSKEAIFSNAGAATRPP